MSASAHAPDGRNETMSPVRQAIDDLQSNKAHVRLAWNDGNEDDNRDEDLKALCDEIKISTALETLTLDWSSVCISKTVGADIAGAIRENTSLQEVEMDCENADFSQEIALCLAEAILTNQRVQRCRLNFADTDMATNFYDEVAELLRHSSLKTLELICNRSTGLGAAARNIAAAIAAHPSLERFMFEITDLEPGMAKEVLSAMQDALLEVHNATLKYLEVRCCDTGIVTADAQIFVGSFEGDGAGTQLKECEVWYGTETTQGQSAKFERQS